MKHPASEAKGCGSPPALQKASPPKRKSPPQHHRQPQPVQSLTPTLSHPPQDNLRKNDTAHYLHLAFYNAKMECDSKILILNYGPDNELTTGRRVLLIDEAMRM
ncbi:hypothetical protein CSV72_16170 [Sporosarcina sp. P20a]|nr:hypothetical protein CSV72_16170 [Sporosarcina sp. P20a]